MFFRRVLCISLCVLFSLKQSTAAEREKPFEIYMVQWRGDTVTDNGFKNFFDNSRIAANFTLKNPAQNKDAFKDIIAEIKEKKPDLVYTWSMASAIAIAGPYEGEMGDQYIRDIPVVSCMVSDPIVAGITTQWGKSGRNVTGVSHVPSVEAQFNAMMRYRSLNKISILYNTQQSSAEAMALEVEKKALALGLEVQMLALPLDGMGISDVSKIPELVKQAAEFKPDFLYLGPDSLLFVNRVPLFEAVNKFKLATFSPADVFLENGDALFGLVGSYYVAGQYCGYKAAQILLEGKAPEDIDFDTLRNFTLKVNMKAAKHLGLFPPMDLLPSTDVIKSTLLQ